MKARLCLSRKGHSGNRRWRRATALLILVFLAGAGLRAFELSGLSPGFGLPGTVVTIRGQGFDLGASYSVTIEGTPCPVTDVTTTALTINVPTGAESGAVGVSEGGGEPVYLVVPFTVMRELSGRLSLPAGVSQTGYVVGNAATEGTLAGDGTVTVQVADTGVTTVLAAREEVDPGFAQVVTGTTTSLAIDAASTAQALVFLTPGLGGRDRDPRGNGSSGRRPACRVASSATAMRATAACRSWLARLCRQRSPCGRTSSLPRRERRWPCGDCLDGA